MNCDSCKRKYTIEVKSSGFWATLFLLILPKCPFCILAYSSTIALCTTTPAMKDHSGFAVCLVVLSGFIVMISMVVRYKGLKTLVCLFLSGIGMILAIQAIANQTSMSGYYIGVFLIAFGLWLNGSLVSLVKFIIQKSKPPTIPTSFYKQ